MFWNRFKKKPQEEVVNNKKIKKQLPLSALKQLVPICNIPDAELREIHIQCSQHKVGDVIFNRAETAQDISYIIEGECFLEAINGSGYRVESGVVKSLYPLSNNTEHHYTAIAKTDVTLVHFPLDILERSSLDKHDLLEASNVVPEHLKNDLDLKVFSEYLKKEKYVIPNLPKVSLQLRTAIQKNIGVYEATKIVNLDPVICSKLIQISNSPLYRAASPINSTIGAINRLGLTTTRNLVTSISLKNLYKSKNKMLAQKIQDLWKRSIHISSICYTLASLNKKINPDEALLAGLIHNIGAYPVIMFADTHDEDYSEQTIDQAIKNLQGLLGNITLENWGFSEHLRKIPSQSENWYHYDSDELDLCDIVILAKYHSLISMKQSSKLPPIHTLPAFQKLKDQALTPDMTLQILQDSKKQISEAMHLFL